MWNAYSVILYSFLFLTAAIVVHIIVARHTDKPIGLLSIETVVLLFLISASTVLALPGTKVEGEAGPVKWRFETPSKPAQALGAKASFKAQNLDNVKLYTILASATSTGTRIEPVINFVQGEEYVNVVANKKDGTERIYAAELPASSGVTAYTSPHVRIGVKGLRWRDPLFGAEYELTDKGKELLEKYYKLDKARKRVKQFSNGEKGGRS